MTVISDPTNKALHNLSSKGRKVPPSAVCKRFRTWPSQNKPKMLKLSTLCTSLKVLRPRCVPLESKGQLSRLKPRKFLGGMSKSKFKSTQSRSRSASKSKCSCCDRRRPETKRPSSPASTPISARPRSSCTACKRSASVRPRPVKVPELTFRI